MGSQGGHEGVELLGLADGQFHPGEGNPIGHQDQRPEGLPRELLREEAAGADEQLKGGAEQEYLAGLTPTVA